MVYFAVMDYSLEDEGVKEHWDIPMYAEHWHFPQIHRAVIPYMIASNCEEVKLFLNEKEFYLPKPENNVWTRSTVPARSPSFSRNRADAPRRLISPLHR